MGKQQLGHNNARATSQPRPHPSLIWREEPQGRRPRPLCLQSRSPSQEAPRRQGQRLSLARAQERPPSGARAARPTIPTPPPRSVRQTRNKQASKQSRQVVREEEARKELMSSEHTRANTKHAKKKKRESENHSPLTTSHKPPPPSSQRDSRALVALGGALRRRGETGET